MAKILAVEDSAEYQLTIRASLEPYHQVIFFSDSDHVVERVQHVGPALILMDIGLPEGDGRQACRELQKSEKTKKIPILFVTGCRNPSDIAEGLSLGAEDYITKPFNPVELRARCEARLRKAVVQQENENLVKAGPITLNLLTRKAYTNGASDEFKKNISLTPSEFQLLHYLIVNADKTVTRQEILESLSLAQHVRPGSRIVDAQIKALRKKSKILTDRIRSVYGKGYQYSTNDPGVVGF